jgi:hypothetical protein
VPDLLLSGRSVRTVFDLLGVQENDLTYSLGWALSQSPRLVRTLLDDVASELSVDDIGEHPDVRLQEYVPGSGFTDVEIRTTTLHVIIEAKRGWDIPATAQLKKYATSLTPGLVGGLLILSEGSPAYAAGYPESVPGPDGEVPVLYRSWETTIDLIDGVSSGASNQSRLCRELGRYLRGTVSMQDPTSNLVYVVALGGNEPTEWSPISPRAIVEEYSRYFHPVGGGSGGWPKEPPNYQGFRYDGRLQSIHHVDAVEPTQRPRDFIEPFTADYDFEKPHYLYTLGPPMEPHHEVKGGKVKQAARVWAALDLLLTCETISEARDLTNDRMQAAGL